MQWRGTTAQLEPDDHLRLHVDIGVPIFYDDLLVPASHTLPAKLMEEADSFDLEQLRPYDPGYLAGWPAEVYQVAVADASLVARRRAWERARSSLATDNPGLADLQGMVVSSAGLAILSYKLILLPFWLGRYRHRNAQYSLVINGQKGTVRGEAPRGKLRRFLESLLDDD